MQRVGEVGSRQLGEKASLVSVILDRIVFFGRIEE